MLLAHKLASERTLYVPYYHIQTQQRPQTDVVAHGFGAVGFPARAGTSPEGHEEACARSILSRESGQGRPYLGAVLEPGLACFQSPAGEGPFLSQGSLALRTPDRPQRA